MKVDIKIKEVTYHRNGICGNGFDVVLFDHKDEKNVNHRMVGIVFEESGNVAVLDVDQTAQGNIAFAGGNSWRGDWFEDELRKAIKEADENH